MGFLTYLKENYMMILGIILFSSFMPLTVISFRRFRLPKKQREYDSIIQALGEEHGRRTDYTLSIDNEYSKTDYVPPVIFVTFFCILTFFVLFSNQASLLLFGIYHLKEKNMELLDYNMLSVLSMVMALLGSYVWAVQYIFRRLVTIDLSPSAYYSIGIRMVLSCFVALIFHHFLRALPYSSATLRMLPVVAFFTGMFPQRMIHFMLERLERTNIFPSKSSEKADNLPLDMIEGMNLYNKVRLAEVGIENAQALAKADLVELILKTAFKPRQILDWIAQAMLYLYFKSDIDKLRRFGIRNVLEFKENITEENASDCAKAIDLSEHHLMFVCRNVNSNPGVERLINAEKNLK